jgi:hypothetical protein
MPDRGDIGFQVASTIEFEPKNEVVCRHLPRQEVNREEPKDCELNCLFGEVYAALVKMIISLLRTDSRSLIKAKILEEIAWILNNNQEETLNEYLSVLNFLPRQQSDLNDFLHAVCESILTNDRVLQEGENWALTILEENEITLVLAYKES